MAAVVGEELGAPLPAGWLGKAVAGCGQSKGGMV